MLETPVVPETGGSRSYIALNLLIVLVILGITCAIVLIRTAPVSGAAAVMADFFWKEALLDRVYIDGDIIERLSGGDFVIGTEGALYGVILLRAPEGGNAAPLEAVIGRIGPLLAGEGLAFKAVSTAKNTAALAVKYPDAGTAREPLRAAARLLLDAGLPAQVSIALSGPQKNFALLPLCYKQCEDALKYRICLGSSILDHALIRDCGTGYEFPSEQARQLCNNIAAGGKDGSAACLDKIFAPLESRLVIISDEQVWSLVVSLQNGALKTAVDLGVSMKADRGPGMSAESLRGKTLGELKLSLRSFFEELCDEITLAKENRDRRMALIVMEYIEKNCLTDHLLSLISVAENFRINKNQVSAIVKEAAGLDFPEFINKTRIEHAKELLLNRDLTVEEIAKAAGYNYAHYFIKIFKSLEGVTPGQYRAARS